MGEWKSRLQQMNKVWGEKKDMPSGCPDGIYNMQMQKLELCESSTGKMMVKREFYCLEGEFEGMVERDQIVIETDFGYRQMSQFIEQMGYKSPDDAGEIEDICAAIINDAPCVQAKVKKQKDNDFKNITVISLIDKPQGTSKPAPKPQVKASAPAAKPQTASKPAAKVTPAAKTPAEATFEVGSEVTYPGDDENAAFTGKITEIKDDGNAYVEVDSGELFEVPLADLVASEEGAETERATAEDDEKRAGLLALAQANGIECSDEDTVETLTETINKFQFKKSELAPEELKLLEEIGGNFEAEAPAKAKPAAKPAPKPAAKPQAKAPAKAPAKAAPKKKK